MRVLFQSADLVLVDKPVGIATEPDKSGSESLRDQVARELGIAAPHAVSRLDVGVSGVVTFATSPRGKAAAAKAQADPSAKKFERRYVALLLSTRPFEGGVVTQPIDGKPAATSFHRVATARAGKGAVVLAVCAPHTGRTHQIRIHAAHQSASILGDGRYGGVSSVADAKGRVLAVERVLLHAAGVRASLGLPTDPAGWITSPIPEPFARAWSFLDGDPQAWKEVDRCVAGSELSG